MTVEVKCPKCGEDLTLSLELLSKEMIERRVYNYAVKLLNQGKTEINTKEAAEELRLTPKKVFEALQALKERGALGMSFIAGSPHRIRASQRRG